MPVRQSPGAPGASRPVTGAGDLARAVELGSEWLGLEAEPVDVPYRELRALIRRAGPAILRIETKDEPKIATLVSANKRRATLVGPDGLSQVRTEELWAALARPLEETLGGSVESVIERAGIVPRRRARARDALFTERLGPAHVAGIWVLRLPASAPFPRQLREAGALQAVAALGVSHAARYAMSLAAWWTLGRGALEGHLDRGWLVAWALLLVTQVPLRLVELRAQARIAIDAAALLKRRLLHGTLVIAPEEMRTEGAGHLLGRTIESNALESLAVSGGIGALLQSVDLVVSGAVLATGAAGPVHMGLLAVWIALAAAVAREYTRRRAAWTDTRLSLTHDLVERMVGHRTRVAQLPRTEWHVGEDEDLTRYLDRSRALDRAWVLLGAIIPAGWLALGLLALAPALVSGTTTASAIALSIGGVILAFRAFQGLASGARDIAGFLVACERVAPLFRAGARTPGLAAADAATALSSSAADAAEPVLSAHDLVFRHRAGGDPVLRGCSLRVRARDRILLEGPSGAGKSTLSLLLAGVRVPESGTLLVNGLDRHTLGSRDWRRRVIAVPQFHENHVLSSTFAFNLLMGREWPPAGADLMEANAVCRELGLGDLLDRMPSGLQQIVGETGWQLSHGERSRLYIARALLQAPEVMVLDESFAALDPETMQVALGCVLRRARALVVVAHP
jgi:ATP-binding cassette subfamily B protein